MRNDRIRTLVEIALSVALALVLSLWKIPLPWLVAGGSVSLAMLPIFVVSFRRGLLAGVTTGAIYGMFHYFQDPVFVHPAQFALDYAVAFGACGLAGLGASGVQRRLAAGQSLAAGAYMLPWILVGTAGRFAASFLSGYIFFAQYAAEGQPVWLYSMLYNVSYILPSAVLCAVLTLVLVPVLQRAVPAGRVVTAG